MSDRLTPKMEKFVNALVSGVSQREAYRAAYSCERSSDRTVDNKASKLFARDDIRARYDSLVAEVADRVLWDRERAARELLEVRDIALAHVRKTTKHKAKIDANGKRDIADLPKAAAQLVIASTAELNKMFGIYDKADADDGKVVIVDDV
jgi:hypothetical protein